MFTLINFVISILAFVLAIGVLVTFHEFGHFWTARRLGVKVLRFSVGLGKPIWKYKSRSGTEYVLSVLPLGGYVKMLDGNEADITHEQKPFAFNEQSVYKRFLIVFAGPMFNFLLAIAAFWLVFSIGVEQRIPIIGKITPNSIAEQAGLKKGFEITAVGEVQTPNWPAIVKEMVPYIGEKQDISITGKNENNIEQQYSLNLSEWSVTSRNQDLFESLGIHPFYPPIKPVIKEVLDSEPAQIAGFKPGDVIVSVNGEGINDWSRFVEKIHEQSLAPMQVEVKRDERFLTLEVTPRVRSYLNEPDKGYLGVTVEIPKDLKSQNKQFYRTERWGVITSLGMACKKTWDYILMTYIVLGKMITGDIGVENLSGPITIAKTAGASASSGFVYYVGFLAIISISLGVLNLLPIPILDGGHLMYYLVEILTRRRVSDKIQVAGYKLGLFVIIFLMTVALYNDIVRMF